MNKKTKESDDKLEFSRNSYLDKDIYDRIRKEARYQKIDVKTHLNSTLRRLLFDNNKTKSKLTNHSKNDLKGYCPNCGSQVKLSTLLSQPKTTSTPPDHKSFWQRIFGSSTP